MPTNTIQYIERDHSFFLQGATSTYAMAVHPSGVLQHLYWGERIAPAPVDAFPCIHFSNMEGIVESRGHTASLDVLAQEYPTTNEGDFRLPALDVEYADGTRSALLLYQSHTITPGKPRLPGLPATYVEDDDEAQTLIIYLQDELTQLKVALSYTVFANLDVIARSACVTNGSEDAMMLRRCLSASLDFPHADFDLLRLPGAWTRERAVERCALHSGAQTIGSRRGLSSPNDHPFFALLSPDATETQGQVYGFSFVYSGNHFGGAEVSTHFHTRACLGIHPDLFAWKLEPAESFQTPEVILAYSNQGLGGMSHQYHPLYRERLCRSPWRDAERPILVNNWEATYFDFDAEKITALARTAKTIGIELCVLDDGWFGKRNDDTSSLGDWVVDRTKLPDGLADLARKVNQVGLSFGLWFEPEMVSPDSDLYRAHPDWCLHIPGRARSKGRNQLVLDFSRPEVVDAIWTQLSEVLSSANIVYIKWDMNRHLSQVSSAGRAPDRQGETFHRYVLGLYSLLERLTATFPHILLECCASGGGRYDPGMLYYMPQTWTSDNSDAISRLKIQHGTSLIYPASTMDANVSPVPNHQVNRVTPMLTRCHVALAGVFGFQIDLTQLSAEDLAIATEMTAFAKQTRQLRATGTLHRLRDPFTDNAAAWMVVAKDHSELLVTYVHVLTEGFKLPMQLPANGGKPAYSYLRLRGLNPDAVYRSTHGPSGVNDTWRGDLLMHVGLPFNVTSDFQSHLWHLVQI
jgi:alpha-galactosidase